MKLKILLNFFAILCFLICNSSAQDKFPPAGDRVGSNYYEGYRKYKNVHALGKVELRSFVGQHRRQITSPSKFFNISFYVPSSSNNMDIEIFIEDRIGKSYYMMPIQKKWTTGQNDFRWSSHKAREQSIKLHELIGTVRVRNDEIPQVIIPLIFYGTEKYSVVEEYEIIFVADRKVTLRYSIENEVERVLSSGIFKNQPRNKDIVIKWDCKNAKPGKYFLVLDYILKNGEILQGSGVYEFFHKK